MDLEVREISGKCRFIVCFFHHIRVVNIAVGNFLQISLISNQSGTIRRVNLAVLV